MAIVESTAVASIISKLLSMSTDLLERKESREVASEIREIQKLMIELHSLYTVIETKHHEIESEFQSQIINLQKENSKFEHTVLKIEAEKDEILKQVEEWNQYIRKVSKTGFVYFAHQSESRVYACAVCKSKEPYPIILQPDITNFGFFTCKTCGSYGDI
jgi:septal ring factor EnvC (AmiA/AmiB activator)